MLYDIKNNSVASIGVVIDCCGFVSEMSNDANSACMQPSMSETETFWVL